MFMYKYILVKDEIEGTYCITIDDGDIIYNLIHDDIKNKKMVILDFKDTTSHTSSFLNAAIGRLLKDIDIITVNKYLKIVSISKSIRQNISIIKFNSKRYYSNSLYRKSVNGVMKKLSKNGFD